MKKIVIIALALFCVLGASAQTAVATEPDTSEVYTAVEVDPEFKGGYEALYQYLATNIHYDEQAREEGVQGKVFVSFVIERDGSVSNVAVLRTPDRRLSDEAVRVVEAMPKWKPGKIGKKKVRVQFTLPVTFTLSEDQ